MDFAQKQYINNFITNVFNYYNGRINIFNYPARLIIEWANRENHIECGLTRNPDTVMIFPEVIARYTPGGTDNGFLFFYLILNTVIHELFHIDQFINYQKLIADDQYKEFIENAVEVQTAIYIANHTNEIRDQFKFTIYQKNENGFRQLIDMYETGAVYERKKYIDHLFSLFNDIIPYEKDLTLVLNTIINHFKNKTGKIIVKQPIQGTELTIQNGDAVINISSLNNYLYEVFFKYDYRDMPIVTTYDKKNDILIISINGVGKYIMAKIL